MAAKEKLKFRAARAGEELRRTGKLVLRAPALVRFAECVMRLLLGAKELGYGTCWCGTYPCEDRVAALQATLEITSVPLAVVSVGVPDESPAARGFFDPARVKYFR